MKGATAARRYARALLGLASETERVDEVAADMRMIRSSVEGSQDLKLFFRSPIIDHFKKRDVVRAIFKKRVSDFTFKFLILLVDKGRESLTYQIAVEFGALLDDMLGIVHAELRSPFELGEKNSSKIKAKLEEMTNKKVRISFSLDKSLVGGFLAQIGDTVYDGSVRRQLELLKEQLSNNSLSRFD